MVTEDAGQVKETVDLLKDKGLSLALAESCTGGLLGHLITNEAGVSAIFKGGVVAYANSAKIDLLGVASEAVVKHGTVSKECAELMAEAARERFNSDIGLSITGIAGPEGGSKEKPVGTVFISLSCKDISITERQLIEGNRGEIKEQAAESAISLLQRVLKSGAS